MFTESPQRASSVLSVRAMRLGLGIALAVTLAAGLAAQLLGIGESLPRLLVMLSSVLAIALSITSPMVAGIAVSALFMQVTWFPELRSLAPIIAAVVVVGAIAYRGHYLAAGVAFVVLNFFGCADASNGSLTLNIDATALLLAILMIGGGGLVGAAFGVIARQRQKEKREMERERQLRREATVRTLHDSVASSLTSAIMRAESLGFEESLPDELGASVNRISNDIREAMKEIRILIKYAHADEWPESDDSEIAEKPSQMLGKAIDVLRGHGFDVVVDGDISALDRLDLVPRKLRLMLSELVANIVKYGHNNVSIGCAVRSDEKAITLSVANAVATAQSATYLSSGIGLADIEQAAAELGGVFTHGAHAGQWVSTLSFPRGQVDTFVSTSENLTRNA